MASLHFTNDTGCSLGNICCKGVLLNSHDIRGTEERVVSKERIVSLLHGVLHIQQALLAEYHPIDSRVDEKESYQAIGIDAYNHEEFTVVYTTKTVGMDNGSTVYSTFYEACRYLHYMTALSKEIISVT